MENNEQNPLFRLKYMGYFMAGFDLERKDLNYDDFVRIAKFYLCELRGVLTKDPIWDKYSNEEILIEYYAAIYKTNKEARETLEAHLNATVDDDEWMDQQVIANRKRREAEKAGKIEDEIFFDPSMETLGNE